MAIEREHIEAELTVVGGGLAGFCAAVAAARRGTRVCLVQDRPVLGGNASSEIQVPPVGSVRYNAWARETGIIEEIMLADRAGNHTVSPRMTDLLLHRIARETPNLTLFLNTSARRVVVDGSRIASILASQLGSERELAFVSQQFVDCTGDATIGVLAGADYRHGRESRSEFGEPLAPLTADAETMGSTVVLRARRLAQPVAYQAPAWAAHYADAEAIGVGRWLSRPQGDHFYGFWWMEVCSPYNTVHDNQAITDELHRHLLGVWDFLKNRSPHRDEFANFALEWVGVLPGKRESRRLLGEVIVREQDCHQDRQWPDRVAFAGWYIDLHVNGGILNKPEPAEYAHVDQTYASWTRNPVFTLPLRAFYSRNIDNLWMAGRNISVTHVALGPVRVMLTTAAAGQAVGTAAAYALQHELSPRQTADPDGPHIAAVQQQLLADDARLPGCLQLDPDDLLRDAQIIASSERELTLEPLEEAVDLAPSRGLILPLTEPQLAAVQVYLEHRGDTRLELAAELQPVASIWDRAEHPPCATCTAMVPAGFSGWLSLPLAAAIATPAPYRLVLTGTADLHWRQALPQPGVVQQWLAVRAGRCDPGHETMPRLRPEETDIPPHRHWLQEVRSALAVRLTPAACPYRADNVGNGEDWPYRLPNLWRPAAAAALPQSLTFTCRRPVTATRVDIRFDTGLNTACPRTLWRAPECTRGWSLQALIEDHWQTVCGEDDNFQRHRRLVFAPVTARCWRLQIRDADLTVGGGVYAVRLFG